MNNGLRFVHVRPYAQDGEHKYAPRGGMTLAYTMPKRRGDKMVYVAVANCSKYDTYCKKKGREIAERNFFRGATIQTALDTSASEGFGTQLQRAFRPLMHLGIPYDNEDRIYEQRMHKSRQKQEERAEHELQNVQSARNQQDEEGPPF